MNRICGLLGAVVLAGVSGVPAADAQNPALDDLAAASAATQDPSFPEAVAQPGPWFARQAVPENNSEPGFNWPVNKSAGTEEYFQTAGIYTYFKINDSLPETLPDGAGKCALAAGTKYLTAAKPGFEGEHVKAALKEPLSGCSFTEGYVLMEHTAATSAGGAWELPVQIRAFLDTLAYSEGTLARYNYIFTFAVFTSYADHPRKKKCLGRLCSDAAGRYQFLSNTWDALAGDLGLKDFTPPSQDRAVMELIRRDGAYKAVAQAAVYDNFAKAVYKLNNIWASLPGSQYGQPTHSMAALWNYYRTALARYQ